MGPPLPNGPPQIRHVKLQPQPLQPQHLPQLKKPKHLPQLKKPKHQPQLKKNPSPKHQLQQMVPPTHPALCPRVRLPSWFLCLPWQYCVKKPLSKKNIIYEYTRKKKLNSAKVSNRRLTWRRRRTFVFHQSKKYKKISFLDRIITNWKSK